jgi:hypothetical protein
LAVHSHAAGGDRQAGAESCQPSDIVTGGPARHGAAEDDIVYSIRSDPATLYGVSNDVTRHRRAMREIEGTAIGLADWRAGSRNDGYLGH